MALISKTGIINGNTIQPEHITRIIDALDGTGSATIIATGSFTGSFKGDGSQLNGLVSASYATSASYVSGGITDGTLTSRVIPFISSSRLFNSSIYQTANDEITIGSIGGSSAMLQVMQSNSGKDGLTVLYTANDANQAAISATTLYTSDLLKLISLTGSFVVKSNGKTIVTGSIEVSNGITGSFKGDGSGLTNLTSTTNSLIAIGSVTASVGISTNSFTVTSGSLKLFKINSSGSAEIGIATTASGDYSYAEGYLTVASGDYSHAEGYFTTTNGTGSHTEGFGGTADGSYSHVEGWQTFAHGEAAHAEGNDTVASGSASHAEGQSSVTNGDASHAEGFYTIASASYSHAEGYESIAESEGSHAEGFGSITRAPYSHAEGNGCITFGTHSHAEGVGTIASGSGQLAAGKWNTRGNTTSLVVIGNGSSDSVRGDLALFNSQSIQFTVPLTGSIISGSFVGNGASITGVVSASFAATASRSTTASFATSATSANQLVSVNRSVYEFTTTNATPYVQNFFAGLQYARYIKAIVIGNSNSGSLGGEFTKFYDHDGFGAGTTELSSTGTLSENIIGGTPAFSISDIAQWTATGVSGVNIDWRVILEYSTI